MFLFSQIGINTTNPQATLEIKSSDPNNPTITDGLIIPRINSLPTSIPTNNQNGMLVFLNQNYNTYNRGFYFWDSTLYSWIPLTSGKDLWFSNGNSNTNPTVNFLGTLEDNDLVLKRNNIF